MMGVGDAVSCRYIGSGRLPAVHASEILFPHSGMNGKAINETRKERPQKRGGGRFEPYGNPSKRYRVFVSNIPFDVKWQALKDLMKEKGNVTWTIGCK